MMRTVRYIEYYILQRPSALKKPLDDIKDFKPNLRDYLYTYRDEYKLKSDEELNEEMKFNILGEIFYKFNMNHPDNFASYSLSVGDIIELEDEKFMCMTIGWKKV